MTTNAPSHDDIFAPMPPKQDLLANYEIALQDSADRGQGALVLTPQIQDFLAQRHKDGSFWLQVPNSLRDAMDKLEVALLNPSPDPKVAIAASEEVRREINYLMSA